MCIPFIGGFLLGPNYGGHGTTMASAQYPTLYEFYTVKNTLQDGIDDLRNDMDKKLTLLMSQLKLMSSPMPSQAPTDNICGNETQKIDNLDQKYQELVLNHTTLQQKFDILQRQYRRQENELVSLRNTTNKHGKQMAEMMKLHTQTINLNTVQQQIKSVSSQTNTLALNQQARNNDFLALYNLTIYARSLILELGSNMSAIINNLESNHNRTSDELDKKITTVEIGQNLTLERKIAELESRFDRSLKAVQQQAIRVPSKKVAVTACIANGGFVSSGSVLQFSDIRTQFGIRNVYGFRATGKFNCEIGGVYLMSAWILSSINGAEFAIFKNRNNIAQAFITNNSDGKSSTATAVVAVDLRVNDQVWVQAVSRMYAGTSHRSCITVVKLD